MGSKTKFFTKVFTKVFTEVFTEVFTKVFTGLWRQARSTSMKPPGDGGAAAGWPARAGGGGGGAVGWPGGLRSVCELAGQGGGGPAAS